jgi:alpha-tubulin suppressor-like RCC1 family protein
MRAALVVGLLALVACGTGNRKTATPITKHKPDLHHDDNKVAKPDPGNVGVSPRGDGELDQLGHVRALSCGQATTCALTDDGKVYCWGDDYALGMPDGASAMRPRLMTKLPKATYVGAGTSAACALGTDRRVYCWGLAPFDVDPAKKSADRVSTVKLNGAPLQVRELSVGPTHACAVDDAGDVLCWGDKRDGKVGVAWSRGGGAWEHREPTVVRGLPATKHVHAGMNATCAIAEDGTLRCFGSNELGGLGVKLASPWTHVPQQLAVDAPVRSVSSGDASCAIDGSGRVVCWGTNDFGQAGDARLVGPTKTLAARPSGMKGFFVAAPRLVQTLDGAIEIHAGGTFTCALRADRTIACWGNNELGALAAPVDNDPHPAPLAIKGIDRARSMCAGTYHACAVTEGRNAMCWGYNASGQLGRDGKSSFETTPALVRAPTE